MKLRKLLLKFTVAACLGLTFMASATSYAQCSTTAINATDGIDATNTDTSDSGNLGNEGPNANIADIDAGDWITFSNLDLSCVNSVDFFAAAKNARLGVVEVRIGNNTGTVIGTTGEISTGGWGNYETYSAALDLSTYTVGNDITFVFKKSDDGSGGGLFNLRTITFSEEVYTAPVVETIPKTDPTECSTTAIAALDGMNANDLNTTSGGTLNAEANNIGDIDINDWISFLSLDLTCVQSVDFLVASNNDKQGVIDVKIGDHETGTVIGTTSEIYTGNWNTYETYSVNLDLSTYTLGDAITLSFRSTTDTDGGMFNFRTITFKETEFLSTNEISAANTTISPNPTTGVVNVTGGNFNLTVLDITGKVLLTSKGNKVDLSNVASGVYILKGENDNGSFAKQIIKK